MDYIKLFQYLFLAFLGILGGLVIAVAIYHFKTHRYRQQNPLPGFLRSREQEIRHLADRIRTGQSSAIIGFFSEERRTILGYLRNENPKQLEELYGDKANQLIFSYIDIAFLNKECSEQQFWEQALEPLRIKIEPDSKLDKAYQTCQSNQFNKGSLENIISLINQQGWRLVLLLDKFEGLLQHPNFKEEWAFFTTLRYLAASRTPSPLVLVIASNQSLKQFHEQTQHLSPSTSPVLNFIEGGLTTLGGLSETEVDELLDDHNEPPIPQQARQFIKDMVGGHPYLLNVAVSEFWKASPNSELESLEALEQTLYDRIKFNLERTINSWSSNTYQAFMTLVKQDKVVGFEKELKELENQGLVAKVNDQWQIRSRFFSKFLIDKHKQ